MRERHHSIRSPVNAERYPLPQYSHWQPILVACLLLATTPAGAGVIDDALAMMPGNSWQKINVNRIDEVYTPQQLWVNNRSPSSNISAWSGAAWNPNSDQFLIWGGDSCCEEGNESYVFHADTGLWERGALPSAIVGPNHADKTTVGGADDAPVSGESYDAVVYLENLDRMAVISISRDGPTFADDDGTRAGPYLWNPNLADPWKVGGSDGTGVDPSYSGGNMWENRDTFPFYSGGQPGTGYQNDNGVDVVWWSSVRGSLMKFTFDPSGPSGDIVEEMGTHPTDSSYQAGAGAYISNHHLFVRPSLTQDLLHVYFLDNAGPGVPGVTVLLDPSLGISMGPSNLLGVDYDPILDQLLFWDGSDTLWSVDIEDLISPDDVSADNGGVVGLHGYFTPELLTPGASVQRSLPLTRACGVNGLTCQTRTPSSASSTPFPATYLCTSLGMSRHRQLTC